MSQEHFDYDCKIERRGSGCIKYDALIENFGCEDLMPLWIADMDFAVDPAITSALIDRLRHPVYGYPAIPESYYNSIIEWLNHRHGMKVERKELAFVPGVVKGIAYAILHFTAKGDGVVIQPPVYTPFGRVVRGNGRRCIENPLLEREDADGNFFYDMDLESLEQLFITEKPRLMVLCNPHNPGGRQWDEQTLRRLAALCRRHNVVVVSDEIHGDLMLGGKPHIPFASVSDDAAAVSVTLGAPSKTFNIPGLVSSWMVVKNPELRRDFYEWMEVNEFSAPTFMAALGAETAYRNCEQWLGDTLEYIEGNIAYACERFASELPDVHPMRPDASFLIWLDCRNLGLTHEELFNRMISVAHVALNPGDMFGKEGRGFLRLNVALPRRELSVALDHIIDALRPTPNC